MGKYKYILLSYQNGIDAIGKVGGRNASLGEMYNQLNPIGISTLNGYEGSAGGYRHYH
jgi:pyruvate,water dikinase